MTTFAGVDHLALTVTDLDTSTRFYRDILDFTPVMDAGTARILVHRATGFVLALHRHDGAAGTPFSELATGLDHVGLVAASRDELERWQERLQAAGVTFTPIRDMPFAHHLNFRDPDGIALELCAPTQLWFDALAHLREREPSAEEIQAFLSEHLGAPA